MQNAETFVSYINIIFELYEFRLKIEYSFSQQHLDIVVYKLNFSLMHIYCVHSIMLSVSDSDAEDPGSPPGGGKIVIVYISCLYSIVYVRCV